VMEEFLLCDQIVEIGLTYHGLGFVFTGGSGILISGKISGLVLVQLF